MSKKYQLDQTLTKSQLIAISAYLTCLLKDNDENYVVIKRKTGETSNMSSFQAHLTRNIVSFYTDDNKLSVFGNLAIHETTKIEVTAIKTGPDTPSRPICNHYTFDETLSKDQLLTGMAYFAVILDDYSDKYQLLDRNNKELNLGTLDVQIIHDTIDDIEQTTKLRINGHIIVDESTATKVQVREII